MFVNIHLSTSDNSFALVRNSNRIILNTKIKGINCATNSLTNTMYYLAIDGFMTDENNGNINTHNLIPVYVGANYINDLNITLSNGTLLRSYEFKVYNTDGNPTTDIVTIDMFMICN